MFASSSVQFNFGNKGGILVRSVTDLAKRRLMNHQCENNELGEKKTSKQVSPFEGFQGEILKKTQNFALFGFKTSSSTKKARCDVTKGTDCSPW